MKVMNGVVEVVNSYEDGTLTVGEYDLGSWKYLWCVFDGSNEGIANKVGSMETVNFVDVDSNVSWDLLEQNIKVEFDKYKEGEIVDGYGVYLNDEEEVEFDWNEVELKMLEGVKKLFEDGMEVSKVLVGGYSIECDNEFVVIVMKM